MATATRGTNTSIVFNFTGLDVSVSDITNCVMTVKQDSKITEYSMSELTLDTTNDKVEYMFSQAETLSFLPDKTIRFELHFIANNMRYKSKEYVVRVDDTDLNREM